MATNYEEEARVDYIRPAWPYMDWEMSEIEDETPNETSNDDDAEADSQVNTYHAVHFDETKESEAPNGTSDDDAEADPLDEAYHAVHSDDTISESSSINALFRYINSPNVAESDDAKTLSSQISSLINKTMHSLSSSFKIFKDSYLLPIGSMVENTKIYKPDEFDFAVILPALAGDDVFALLMRDESISSSRSIGDLIDDMDYDSIDDFMMRFTSDLRELWANEMRRNATDDWEILDTICCLDDVSVAGTFHIKRLQENDIVDLDICFWIPLTVEKLSSAPDSVKMKHYLRKHCLDQHGLVYAILTRDRDIRIATNYVKYPMSSLVKQSFEKCGQDNNRVQCYRLCKCLVHHLVPKYRKRDECSMCFDSIISSFALKNTVLYMMNAYKTDDMWADGQLVNRVIEVFSILYLCMTGNVYTISAFFSPYRITLDSQHRFNPETCCIETPLCEFFGQGKKPCKLPNLEEIIAQIEDPVSKKALSEYDYFLRHSRWHDPEVVCKLYELLCVLREEDVVVRERLVDNIGGSVYGLEFRDDDAIPIVSVTTHF